jgi:hypothetical protein
MSNAGGEANDGLTSDPSAASYHAEIKAKNCYQPGASD